MDEEVYGTLEVDVYVSGYARRGDDWHDVVENQDLNDARRGYAEEWGVDVGAVQVDFAVTAYPMIDGVVQLVFEDWLQGADIDAHVGAQVRDRFYYLDINNWEVRDHRFIRDDAYEPREEEQEALPF